MIPRNRIDIGWSDLAFALRCCIFPGDRQAAQARVERNWSDGAHTLASLSVRSGFDALLSVLALPRGSEILVSAITIRDMTCIIEAHGLRAVPVDLDVETLSVRLESLTRAITPRSKAILVAHLFGSRMELQPVVELARRHHLLVLEDCAQCYAADGYRGHPGSDAALFSFGPIKTATALGGALLRFRDAALCRSVRDAQARQPVQSLGSFLGRVCKYLAIHLVSYRLPYSLFAALCRLARTNHDAIISKAVRGFPGAVFLDQIRRQPCFALLTLLQRRLAQRARTRAQVERRVAAATIATGSMPMVWRPGSRAGIHSHWVFPILSADPDQLVAHLWRHGFDGTRGASSLYVVQPLTAEDPGAIEARRAMERIAYLPICPGMSNADLRRMAEAVARFETSRERGLAPARLARANARDSRIVTRG